MSRRISRDLLRDIEKCLDALLIANDLKNALEYNDKSAFENNLKLLYRKIDEIKSPVIYEDMEDVKGQIEYLEREVDLEEFKHLKYAKLALKNVIENDIIRFIKDRLLEYFEKGIPSI